MRARDAPVYPGSSLLWPALTVTRGIREIIGRDKRKRRPRVLMRLLEREKCWLRFVSSRVRPVYEKFESLKRGRMRLKCVG